MSLRCDRVLAQVVPEFRIRCCKVCMDANIVSGPELMDDLKIEPAQLVGLPVRLIGGNGRHGPLNPVPFCSHAGACMHMETAVLYARPQQTIKQARPS